MYTLDEKAAAKFLTPENKEMLRGMKEVLNQPLTAEGFENLLRRLAEERGVKLGAVAQPLRVALTGQTASVPVGAFANLLNRQATANH